MLPLIGDSIQPDEANPSLQIPLMVLSMTALCTARSLTTPPALTYAFAKMSSAQLARSIQRRNHHQGQRLSGLRVKSVMNLNV